MSRFIHSTVQRSPLRMQQWFVFSAGVILVVTGVAKSVGSTGDASILRVYDPILGLPFRQLLMLVAAAEIIVACLCFSPLRVRARSAPWITAVVAGLASAFLAYRASLWLIGWKRPCGCLGHLTDVLGISAETADWIAVGLLAYLLAGSYGLLLVELRRGSTMSAARLKAAPSECGK